MDLSYLLLALIFVVTLVYWLLTKSYDHWNKQNVPSLPDPIVGIGHIWPLISLRQSMSAYFETMYNSTDASMIGFYFMQTPAILMRDPELVKCVLQTNFMSFRNNASALSEKADPVLSKNPFFITDIQKWKESRARTTSHLSGKKLRQIFIIIKEVCSKMSHYIDRKIENNNDFYECELKKHFIKATGEVVANSAFGIEGQSFEDDPDRMSFANVAKTLFEPTLINAIRMSIFFFLPKLAEIFNIAFLEKHVDRYFRENLIAIMKERKEKNIAPNDYLQFCIDANSEDNIDSIIADVLIFWGDVYETSSITLASLFYFLSINEDVQEKLREHIHSTIESSNGTITYESLKNMNYMDQVLFETMRLFPPLGAQSKLCTEEITLEGSDGLTCHLQPGDKVFIPVIGLHRDEKYWPEPEKFDPERFSAENQAKRDKCVFLPFGEGPRKCVGMRLGTMLVKLVTASLLMEYSIEHSSKTKLPLVMESTPLLYFKGGLWAKFKKLNKTQVD